VPQVSRFSKPGFCRLPALPILDDRGIPARYGRLAHARCIFLPRVTKHQQEGTGRKHTGPRQQSVDWSKQSPHPYRLWRLKQYINRKRERNVARHCHARQPRTYRPQRQHTGRKGYAIWKNRIRILKFSCHRSSDFRRLFHSPFATLISSCQQYLRGGLEYLCPKVRVSDE